MPADYKPKTRIVAASGKIYDITHADVLEHSVALPAGLPENTRIIYVGGMRMAGTGVVRLRSVSGQIGYARLANDDVSQNWYRAADGLFYYRLTVINDDWDIYINGYITGSV